jgi:hypothetical protein
VFVVCPYFLAIDTFEKIVFWNWIQLISWRISLLISKIKVIFFLIKQKMASWFYSYFEFYFIHLFYY